MGGPKADESDWSRRGLGPGGDARLQAFLAEHRHDWVDATGQRFRAATKLQKLEQQLAAADADDRAGLREEITTARQELAKAEQTLHQLQAQMPPYAIAAKDAPDAADTELRIRGVASSRADAVPRGFLQVASFEGQPEVNPRQSGRLELAHWITAPENPLTARVFVNRVWKHLMREGIVRSVDNFGTTGEAPTHPELLDHLARRFIDRGWRLKDLVRQIVVTRTYRRATAVPLPGDPENRLLAHQHRRRLEPEEIRDTLLMISGTLDRSQGTGMIDHLPIGDVSNLGEALEIEDHRRTVYQPVIRTLEPDVLQLFDAANSAMVTGARSRTIVAPQALYFLNSPAVQQAAALTARRIAADVPSRGVDPIIRQAMLRIVCRPPTAQELAILRDYLSQQFEGPDGPTDHDVMKLCQAILASTQFQFLQ